MIQISSIAFEELQNFNDNESVILSGITFDGVDSIKEVDDFFHEQELLSPEKHITKISRVSGNLRGDEGRADHLLHLTKEGSINVMARLQLRMSGMPVMWTSDFIDNYRGDYL